MKWLKWRNVPTDVKAARLAFRWRNLPVLRVAGVVLAVLLALQAITIAVLSFVVAARRQRRKPIQGFPHEQYTDIGVGNNHLRVYTYGRDLYDAMIAAIDYAEDRIYLETFIWKGDAVGEEFKQRLIKKAKEGVQVYVVYDTFGNLVVPQSFKHFPPEVHVMPFRGIRRPWHIVDPRRYALDHRKLLVVDGKIGFIGGYNLGALYSTEWRDTHLRVRGPAAADLAQSFVDFWNQHSLSATRIEKHYTRVFDPLIGLRGNDAIRLTFPIRDMYIQAIERAQSRILLTNAYFVPDHILLEALQDAAKRGVDVQVLVPWTSNHIVADWASRAYFSACLEAGIRIFGYRKAMIHAKTCTIDGEWTTIGTANLDRLSSVGNFEINLEVYNSDVAHQMEEIFAVDKTNAFELTLQRWVRRPTYVKASEFILAPLRVML
ncbi:MAG: phospholipase D-like domain-containing protein [Ktedonobacterales bacterium]